MSSLFESCAIGNLQLPNRFLRSATWDATADVSGAVTDRSAALYRELAKGEIGLIISGYAFVSDHGKANPGQYGVHTDEMIPGLRRLADIVHEQDGRIALQIVHSGINSRWFSPQGIPVLAMSHLPEFKHPQREMTTGDIEGIIADFAAAAVRGIEAGYDAIQLHGAHSYLMSQVISPLYNQRTDAWGGTPENRLRFHLEVIRAVRKAIGDDFPLFIKFGITDEQDGGLTLEEGIEATRQMVAAGLDAVEVSTGIGQAIPRAMKDGSELTPFREQAAAAKHAVSVPVGVVAGIRTLDTARDIIDSGDADMVAMCRPFIREPHLIARWRRGDTASATCISCNRCMPIVARGEPLVCGEDLRLRETTET